MSAVASYNSAVLLVLLPRMLSTNHLLMLLAIYGYSFTRRYKWASQSGLQIPSEVTVFFSEHVSNWNCDMFEVEKLTNNQPLRFTAYELFQTCDIPKRHEVFVLFLFIFAMFGMMQVMINILDNFLVAVENGYKRYKNPYHNSTHAADVIQTVYCLIKRTGIMVWASCEQLYGD